MSDDSQTTPPGPNPEAKKRSKSPKKGETRLQLFARAYTSNGGKSRDAAIFAGVKGTDGAIAVTAHRLLRRAREQGLLEAEIKQAEARVMTAREVMERLSQQASADLGYHLEWDEHGEPYLAVSREHTAILREYTEDVIGGGESGDKPVILRRKIKVADPHQALQSLAKIYGLEKSDVAPSTIVLANVPPGMIRELYRHMLAGGENGGNGNGAAIEVQGKRVG